MTSPMRERARAAWDIWGADEYLANAPNEVIAERITDRVAAALEAAVEECAKVAERWEHSPGYEIAGQIRSLKDNP